MVDGQHLVSNAFAAKRTTPLLMSGAVIHILPAGSQFDLTSRTLLAHETAVPDPEVLKRVPLRPTCGTWYERSPPKRNRAARRSGSDGLPETLSSSRNPR